MTTADGALLIGRGDGGSGGDPKPHGQNPSTLLAKMIRLDPDANGTAARANVLARGVRNACRCALDAVTSDLYIADVGRNTREDVHVVPLDKLEGKNFG